MNNEILIGVVFVLVLLVLILFSELRKLKKTKPPPIESPAIHDALIEEKKQTIEILNREKMSLIKEVMDRKYEANQAKRSLASYHTDLNLLKTSYAIEEAEYESLCEENEKMEREVNLKYTELNTLVANIQSIITEQKRKALEDTFYTLHISEDIQNRIIEITNFAARFPEIQNAVASVIYNHFFAAEVASLCNRVLGQGKRVTGIYKITNIKNGMVYVGRSVDIRNRWTQHIKRAVGTEKETQNLLYPAMREFKVWNFSFEVLEECDKDSLNEREKFYQDVYKAKEDYSIK